MAAAARAPLSLISTSCSPSWTLPLTNHDPSDDSRPGPDTELIPMSSPESFIAHRRKLEQGTRPLSDDDRISLWRDGHVPVSAAVAPQGGAVPSEHLLSERQRVGAGRSAAVAPQGGAVPVEHRLSERQRSVAGRSAALGRPGT